MLIYIATEQVDTNKQFPCSIGIAYNEKNKYGYKQEYPYEIILNFGDYPIILKRSKNEETIKKEFKKLMKKSKLLTNPKMIYPKETNFISI